MSAALRTTTTAAATVRRAIGLAITAAGAGLWVAQATQLIQALDR